MEETLPTVRSSMRATMLAVSVIALGIAARAPSVVWPFASDDRYVLANVTSPSWHDRAFAFNVDNPGPHQGAWYDGIHYQRRFVRVPASLLLAGEVALFGRRALPLHLASLALHLLAAAMLFHFLRRALASDWAALAGAAGFAVHPVGEEVVAWLACQPIAVAAVFAVLAAGALLQLHARESRARLAIFAAACVLGTLSYEAAVVLPAILLVEHAALSRRAPASSRLRRQVFGVALASWVLLLSLSAWNRAGVTASETSFRPTAGEVANAVVVDGGTYVFKLLGTARYGPVLAQYWVYNALGEPWAPLLAAVVVALVVWLARRDRVAWFGLAAYAAFFLPPFIVRSTVGMLNQPTLRQLYLPLLGCAVVIAALSARRRWVAAVAAAWIVTMAVLQVRPPWGPPPFMKAASRNTRAALQGLPPATPVIVVGHYFRVGVMADPNQRARTCPHSLEFDLPNSHEWRLVPLMRSQNAPTLTREDDRTFVAYAPDGFDFPMTPRRLIATAPHAPGRYGPGVMRAPVVPPPLVSSGVQQLDGARVEVTARTPDAIRGLRFRLERPIDDFVFLYVNGCTQITKLPSP